MVSGETETTEKLHNYELVIILKPDLADENVEAVLNSIKNYVSGRSGIIADIQKWGKRRLAYPIKHSSEGIYYLLTLKAKANQNRELESNLKISESVLRHLLIKID